MRGGFKCLFMIICTYTRQTFIDFFLAQRILLLIFLLFGRSHCVTMSLCDMEKKECSAAKWKSLQVTCLLSHSLYVVTYVQCFITVEGAIEVFKN